MQQAFLQQNETNDSKNSYLLTKNAVVEYVSEPEKIAKEDIVKDWQKNKLGKEDLEIGLEKADKYNNAVENYQEALKKHEYNIKTGYYIELAKDKNLSAGDQNPKDVVDKYLKEEKEKLILAQEKLYSNMGKVKDKSIKIDNESESLKSLPKSGNVFLMKEEQTEKLKEHVKNGGEVSEFLKNEQIKKKTFNNHLDLKLSMAGDYMKQSSKENQEHTKIERVKRNQNFNASFVKDTTIESAYEKEGLKIEEKKSDVSIESERYKESERLFKENEKIPVERKELTKEKKIPPKDKLEQEFVLDKFDIKSHINEARGEEYAILGEYGYENNSYDWIETFNKTDNYERGVSNKNNKDISNKDKSRSADDIGSSRKDAQVQKMKDTYINSLQKANKYKENRSEKVQEIQSKELENDQIKNEFYSLPFSERQKIKEQARTDMGENSVESKREAPKKDLNMFRKLENKPKIELLP